MPLLKDLMPPQPPDPDLLADCPAVPPSSSRRRHKFVDVEPNSDWVVPDDEPHREVRNMLKRCKWCHISGLGMQSRPRKDK